MTQYHTIQLIAITLHLIAITSHLIAITTRTPDIEKILRQNTYQT